jgi:chromosome segregation protein
MRIKKVDLLGFKSFCDRTTLDFQNNISCVVGPNGCGKSNIVDALRWAMGEQSARHLRGKSMEDVIFSGSDTRGPSGLSEVSVTFENDGRVPAEYLDYAEIKITRRLDREGNSEYLLNNLPVRLRDITNLFLGTGVGTKAYSIIEQGRIGLIVSARPEDRRHFIEEAAGITKFQRRKRTAERRMEATRQNLLRVSDVLEEIGKRLGSLRRQARKAERYKAYKSEMRDIELWSATHELLQLLAEEKFEGLCLEDREHQRQEAGALLERRETELEAERLAATEQESRLSGIQEELYAQDNNIKLDESNIDFKTREADELEQRAAEALKEAEDLARQLKDSDVQLARAAEEQRQLQQERQQLVQELLALEARLGRRREELSQAHQALDRERTDLAGAERVAAQAEATLRALRQRQQELSGRLEHSAEEMDRVARRSDSLGDSARDLDGELSGLRDSAEQITHRRRQLRQRLESLQEQAARGEAELEVLRTERHRRQSRLTSLLEIAKRYEGFSRGTRAIMQQHNGNSRENGVLGLVADMVEAPDQYETALEAVLGQRLGTIIVESERVGLAAIEYLKQNAKGRSSFINRYTRKGSVLDRAPVGFVWEMEAAGAPARAGGAPGGGLQIAGHAGVHGPMLGLIQFSTEYRQVAESLLGDVLVVDTLEHALDHWDQQDDKTLVTLDGEILGPDGTVTGGSQDAEVSGVLRQKREIKELEGIIQGIEDQYREALDRHLDIKRQLVSAEQALEALVREGHQGDKDILTREKDLGRISSEMEALSGRQQELRGEVAQMRELQRELVHQEHHLRRQMAEAEEQAHLARDVISLLVREERRLGGLADDAARDVTEGKVRLAQVDGRCRSVEEVIRSIEETRRDRTQRIARLQQGATEGQARAADLRRQAQDLRQELAQLVTRRAETQQRLEQQRSDYEQLLAHLGQLELDLKQVRAQVAGLREGVSSLQLKLSELALNRRHLEQQILDRYRVPLRHVAGEFHMRPPVTPEQLDRLGKLRQLMERMGEINLTAIEEYEELSQRFEFLSTQKDDLEGALAQLQRAIQKINRTCRRRFKETFELVDAKFQEIFPRLFNGGRARLMLTEQDNLLETGVEIAAQPPGKKLQSIDLLSGGEKALTAVSLIFSMFLVKPTPFCLLDEVDAPLDEANVQRFGEMVQEMSASSQFILITHNRRSMEIADRLYGVTMEEAGISRMVSVNLSEGQALVD